MPHKQASRQSGSGFSILAIGRSGAVRQAA